MNERKAPEIRFKGFTDDWEQRKVSDLLEERNEQAPESEDYPLMAFIANEGVAPKGERYDRGALVKDAENKNYKKTELGDFIYSSNNLETGSIGLNNYGKASISPVYSIFKPTGISDSDFIGRRFVRKDFINEMVKWRQGVVYGQWRIHESDFLKIEVAVPSLDEQRKIGAFLSELDNLITLHQRKHKKLLSVKKSMLEKMFPQNGAKVPKIRFEGFTDDWEQRKFSEIAQRESATKKSSTDFPSVEYEDVVSEAGILNKDVRLKETQKTGIGFDGSQVLYGKLRPYLHNWLNPDFSGVAVGDWWVLKPVNVDKSFLFRLIQTEKFDDIANRSSGSKMPRADWNLLSNTEFMVPAEIEEESKIGQYFSELDHLITLHQRELDKLVNIKKSMLEKMFV